MNNEFYEMYVEYVKDAYEYMWLELAMKAKWQLVVQGE